MLDKGTLVYSAFLFFLKMSLSAIYLPVVLFQSYLLYCNVQFLYLSLCTQSLQGSVYVALCGYVNHLNLG